jgi:hypothetical protein
MAGNLSHPPSQLPHGQYRRAFKTTLPEKEE